MSFSFRIFSPLKSAWSLSLSQSIPLLPKPSHRHNTNKKRYLNIFRRTVTPSNRVGGGDICCTMDHLVLVFTSVPNTTTMTTTTTSSTSSSVRSPSHILVILKHTHTHTHTHSNIFRINRWLSLPHSCPAPPKHFLLWLCQAHTARFMTSYFSFNPVDKKKNGAPIFPLPSPPWISTLLFHAPLHTHTHPTITIYLNKSVHTYSMDGIRSLAVSHSCTINQCHYPWCVQTEQYCGCVHTTQRNSCIGYYYKG